MMQGIVCGCYYQEFCRWMSDKEHYRYLVTGGAMLKTKGAGIYPDMYSDSFVYKPCGIDKKSDRYRNAVLSLR